jgi:excisionase family DNA binding protein
MTYDLSPTEAAERLHVSVDTVKRWAQAGKVPAIRTPGGWWKFSADELDEFVRSLRNTEQTEPAA